MIADARCRHPQRNQEDRVLLTLALGLAGDVFVVVQKVTESQLVSVVSALVILAVFWELWFGLTLYRRTQREYVN